MLKKIRQHAIKEIIISQPAYTQQLLVEELKKVNINTSQATVSRDIAELKLVKTKGKYLSINALTPSNRATDPDVVETFRQQIVSLFEVQNLLVVRTVRGGARSVGLMLDRLPFSGKLIGTVADSETLLIVARSADTALEIKQFIWNSIAESQRA